MALVMENRNLFDRGIAIVEMEHRNLFDRGIALVEMEHRNLLDRGYRWLSMSAFDDRDSCDRAYALVGSRWS